MSLMQNQIIYISPTQILRKMEFPNQKQIYKSDRIYIISINNLLRYLLFNVGWYCKFCMYTFNASSFNYSIAPNIHFQYAKCIGNETHTNIFQYNSVTDFKKSVGNTKHSFHQNTVCSIEQNHIFLQIGGHSEWITISNCTKFKIHVSGIIARVYWTYHLLKYINMINCIQLLNIENG